MALTIDQVAMKVENLRRAAAGRDQRMKDVHDVRSGEIDNVIPGAMPDAWPKPIVANLIDTSARDIAEVMGVMPSINCSAGVITTDKAKKYMGKRTKIANHYVQYSNLNSGHQVEFCDNYNTYGMAVYVIEPDFENKLPRIRVENPIGVYPEIDLYGNVRSYTKIWREESTELIAKFPSLLRILQANETSQVVEREVEVAKYVDGDQMTMYLPAHANQVVSMMPNPMGKVYVAIAKRPGFDREVRGAFDDAIWVQLAKSRMALLGLESTEKSVRAPLAVPRDVQKMTFGDDAIIRTDNPDKVRRIGIDVPQYAFQEGQLLENELRVGTRTPEARSGNMDASVITGRGVQALMGGFNTVITTGQTVISTALRQAIALCFEMDEKLWPGIKKTVKGVIQGVPFEETYAPSKDIAGGYTADVTYGFAAGQDPARAIVALLQLRGDQLVSRDFVQRQLPMDLDVVQLQVQIDNEQMTDALKQGMMAFGQNIPAMSLQGMDPMDGLTKMAKVIDERDKGTPFHEAVLKVFKPKEAPQAAQSPLDALMGGQGQGVPAGAPGAGSVAPGGNQGLPGQVQGMDLQTLLAGLTSSGQPNMTANVRRQQAA